MANLAGYMLVDGVDVYTNFNVFLLSGGADFLKYPPKKSSIEHDWKDSNGRDVDLTTIFFDQREGNLELAIIADDEDDFFAKQQGFIALFAQPGIHRLELKAHGQRDYNIYYKDCSSFTAVKALNGDNNRRYAYKFTINVVEPEPKLDPAQVFITDHDGNFLIA